MIKINLVSEAPTATVAKRKRTEFSLGAKQGDIILVTVLAIAVAVCGTWWFILKSKRAELKEIERQRTVERDELQPYIDKVEELEAKRALLKRKVDVINELKNKQRGPVRIMDEVSRALPELVWLTQLKLSGTSITLTGEAMDENAVANYYSNLDSSPFFEEPLVKNIARKQEDFAFTLTATFTYEPPEIQKASSPADGT
ncbi:MAG: PilN domain-containing protein [Thermoanaerobaculales bacterium]|jgi:type IV pilus assembly protein PilN|nr:PilN domain-containing protein [Thermoanaerobaculales bacterium]